MTTTTTAPKQNEAEVKSPAKPAAKRSFALETALVYLEQKAISEGLVKEQKSI